MSLSPAAHFLCLLLALTGSVVRGQTLIRIAESREPDGTDYTGQIRQFSEIGPGGSSHITPRPWLCYTFNLTGVIFERPDGIMVSSGVNRQATGSELFQRATGGAVFLHRGPDYNGPSGDYCCVRTNTNERRCVTLTTCPMLALTYPNGKLTYNSPLSVVTYGCVDGYLPSITAQRTCQINSQWSGTVPSITCTATCPDLPGLTNGVISYSPSTTPRMEGTVATHSCGVGYSLSEGLERTCRSDRTWSGGDVKCTASCSNLTLDNGMIVFTPPTSPLLAGTVATHTCSHGYWLSGDVNRTCLPQSRGGGVWSGGQLTCIATCDDLSNITNGRIAYSPSFSPILMDTTATYTCLFGLPLMGDSLRVCLSNRSWSGMEPHCQRVFFQLGGTSYVSDNSELTISEVGVGDSGLVCRTDHPQCCGTSSEANWFDPNNTLISSTPGEGDFFITRGDGYITLYRICNARVVPGTYCCSVPVDGNSSELLCAVLIQDPETETPSVVGDNTAGYSVAITVILVMSLTVVVTLLIFHIIRIRQLKKAIRTQTASNKQPTNETSNLLASYENVGSMDMDPDGAIANRTNTQYMELRQCLAYEPAITSTEQSRESEGEYI